MSALQRIAPRLSSILSSRCLSTRTAESLLSDASVTSVLAQHKLDAHDTLNNQDALLSLIRVFRTLCDKPMASNAFLRIRTAADIADYYEAALAPPDVQPHVRRMLDARVEVENVAPLQRIESTPEAVRQRFETDLPSNLHIDPSTFNPRPVAIMQTGKRPANVPGLTKKDMYEMRIKKKLERKAKLSQ